MEVPKFGKKQEELETKFDKWLYVLKHLEFLERLPEGIQEKIFAKVMDIAQLVNLDKKERKAYEESLKHYRDLKNALDSSEAKGEAKGREIEKKNSVINFYKAGVSVETISKATQLDIKAINAILADTGMLD